MVGVCKRCDSKGDSDLSAAPRDNEGQVPRAREGETGAKGGRGGSLICGETGEGEGEGLRRQGVRPFSSAAKNTPTIADSYWLSSVN
jgi:hypothetical protein